MDFFDLPLSNNGFDCVLVVVDRLSKHAHFLPTRRTATAREVAHLFFREVFRHHGLPESIITDRDTRFLSDFWQTIFRQMGTSLRFSTAFHPQTDGQTERVNCSLGTFLRAYVHDHEANWDTYLTAIEVAYNNATHASTGHSPFFLAYGYHPTLPSSLPLHPTGVPLHVSVRQLSDAITSASQHLRRAQAAQARHYDRRHRNLQFNVNDQVLLSLSCFE
jgi:hypothetical protein